MKIVDNEDRASWGLFFLCFFVYVVISMAKSAYSASMAAIISEGFFTKSYAGIINSAFYLFYGGAQLLGGKVMDKSSPAKLITVALLGSVISVFLMGFSKNFISMLLFWSLSGLSQFAIWPAVLRIMAEYMLPMHRQKAMVYISFGYCIGMLFNYLMAAVFLKYLDWQMLFFVEGIILGLTFLIWILFSGNMMKTLKEANATYKKRKYESQESLPDEIENISITKLMFISGAGLLLVPAFIRSCLDYGIKAWVPTMIMESYGVSASFATTLTIILLVVNLSGIFITDYLYPKYIKNAAAIFGVCFLVSLPFTALLLFTGKISVWLIVLMLIVVTTMMYGGNRIVTVIIPSFYTKYGKVGSMAGILNAIASFGILVSTYGFGVLAEKMGWSSTIISWIIIAAVALIFCVAAVPIWRKFTNEN